MVQRLVAAVADQAILQINMADLHFQLLLLGLVNLMHRVELVLERLHPRLELLDLPLELILPVIQLVELLFRRDPVLLELVDARPAGLERLILFITGIAALILSQNPALSPADVAARIVADATPTGRNMGAGSPALLAYAEDDAGGLMSTRFARVRPDMNVDEAITYLRKQARERLETIY